MKEEGKFESLMEIKDKMSNVLVLSAAEKFTYRRYRPDISNFETLAYAGHAWAWKDDSRYYEHEKRDDSTFGLPVSHLKSVCWFDPYAEIHNVIPGGHNNLYLLHAARLSHDVNYHSLFNGATLHVELFIPKATLVDPNAGAYQEVH
jgi:hypothetical protein